ncbi:MAG: hypothetical protein KBT13_09820 [Bacteroidales bacterium]|nr:hypothetical protein [Candidatus Sodaliphilus limicaballi]
MAKSNSFFGLRRGSTKSHTYQVLKGQQITKDRVSYVSNPRSDAQMTQRSQFLSAVRFYQRSNQRFFRFAFENKRQRESEYNAFMRLNANLGGYITKAQGDAVGFPMVAPWILAQGSMAPIAQSMVDNGELERSYLHIVVSPNFSDAAPTTIGGVSAAFKASYPDIAEGDIITLVDISYTEAGNAFVEDFDAKDVTGSNLWRVQQFFINSNDDRAISTVLRDVTCEVVGGSLVLILGVAASDTIGAAACVLTRNTKSGLKVATTALSLNVTAVNVYELMRSNSHREQVLAWWGSQQMAILQGSLAEEQGGPEPTPTIKRIKGSVLQGADSCVLQSDLKAPFAAADGTKFILAMAGQFGQTPDHLKNNVVLTANGGTISGQVSGDIVEGTITLTQSLSADGTIQFNVESSANFLVNTTIVLGMVVVGNSVIYNDSYTTPARRVIAENEFFTMAFYTMGVPVTGVFEEGDKVVISVESAEKSGFITLNQFVPGDPEEDEPSILKSADNILGIEIESNYATDDYTQLSIYTDSVKLGYEATLKVVSVTSSGVEYPIANN